MKQTEISKSRGWWKHLLLLCVTLLGMVGFATAGTPNYPFPQNYQYPNGQIYTGSNVQSTLQSLYTEWKSNYYTTSGDLGRVKFVQEGESGTNSVSEGIAYGMLIFVFMDNSTNNTQEDFDRLWRYYKKNSNNNGVMNWKVNAFTGQVTAGSGNANGATDADVDAAQALLLAHKQWGSNGTINYLSEAKTLINAIWNTEVNGSKYLKPGDMFDDYKNPCYFITNALQLFANVEKKEGWTQHAWSSVISNCYSLMKKAANSSTGLIPDWCYENGSYLKGLINSKFESIFGYDAVRIPWRMAHAYAWYGHKDAYDIADKITSWCQGKYPNPDDIVDGYQLNGTPGTGGLGGSLASWGTSKNACFKGGLSMGAMIDTKYKSYLQNCWSVGSAKDIYGKYYTHTTQLLFMMCITGNMPNFWDMLPVPDAAETNADGTVVYVDFSKDIASSGLSTAGWTIKTYADDEDASATSISVSKIAVNSSDAKRLVLTLSSEISEPVITLSYSGSSVKAKDDGAKADAFEDFEVANKVTSMEPYAVARYTNDIGTKLYVQWSKDIALGGATAANFTVFVDGTSVGSPASIQISDEDADVLELVFDEAFVTSAKAEVTLSFAGGAVTSTTGTKTAKAFTKSSVQNFYLSVSCFELLNAATGKNVGFAGAWAGAGSFTSTTYGGIPVYSWSNKSAAYANLQTYTGSTDDGNFTQSMSAADLAAFQEMTSKSGLRLKGRIYVVSDATKGLQFQLNDGGGYGSNYGIIDLSNILKKGEWVEFDEIFSDHTVNYQTYNPSFTYTGAKIRPLEDGDNGSTKNYEIYIDYLQLCPPNPSVNAMSGKVSYDGMQVELKFSTGMRVPIVNEFASCPVEIYSDGELMTVTSVETKVGDATTLIFNLEEPIGQSSTVTASYADWQQELKSVDGRYCENIDYLELANLVNLTVATGWYDDFDDATDYVTWEIAGDGKVVTAGKDTENASKSVLEVTQKGEETWTGALTISSQTAGYVMDLSGREKVSLKVSTASGTMNGYYRIDFIDYFENLSEGDWTAISIPTSGTTIDYTSMNFEIIDRSAIDKVLFRFVSDKGDASNDYTPTFYKGQLNIDYISVGKALTLKVGPAKALDQSQGVDENSTITATSSANGYIYVVPYTTTPQFSELEAVVADKKGVKVACTEDNQTNVSLEGIGYGFFYVYAYDPDAGALSSKVAITVNDVTPPTILECTSGEVTSDASVSATSSEDGTIYVVKSSETGITDEGELKDVSVYYSIGCSGNEPVTILVADLFGPGFEVGDECSFYSVDASGNVSAMADCKFTIKPEMLKIDNVYVEEDPDTYKPIGPISSATSKDIVKVMANRPFTKAYLVVGNGAVTAETIASVADITATTETAVAELDMSKITVSGDGAITHIYITDGTALVGPYDLEVTVGTVYLSSLETEVEKVSVAVGGTVSVKVIENPLNATDKVLSVAESEYATFAYRYDSEKNENYIDVTGVASTAGTSIDMIISGNTETGTTSTTVKLTVVQAPTSIAVTDASGNTGTTSVAIGATQQLTATVLPETADNKEFTWYVSAMDSKYVTVTDEGVIKGIKETDSPVTVKAISAVDEEVFGSIAVSVTAVQVSKITANPKTVTIAMGSTEDVLVSIAPNDATDKTLVATSAEETVATASYNATSSTLTILGVGVGETTITLKNEASGVEETVTVTVTCPITAPTSDEVEQLQQFCQGTAGTLAVKSSFVGTPVWYEAATGGSALAAAPAVTETTAAGSTDYYVAKMNDGCESASRLKVTQLVSAKPVAEIGNTELSFCATTETVELQSSIGTGEWTATKGGSDVTATVISGSNFLPKTAGAGTYTITLTRGSESCGDSDSKEFVVTAAPTVSVSVPESICSDDEPIILAGIPAGGTWSGDGVVEGHFDPSNGSASLTYTYIDGACKVEQTETFKVTAKPEPAIEGLKASYCANDEVIDLSKLSVSPATGVEFSIAGSAVTSIDPANGNQTLTLTTTKDGCTGSKEYDITVVEVPTIEFGDYQTAMCDNADAQTLTATPEGGDWSANAPSGVFSPSAYSGDVTITYTATANGCSNSGEATVTVNKTVAPAVERTSVGIVTGAAVPELSATGTSIKWYTAEDGEAVATTTTYTPEMTTDVEATVKVYVTNTEANGCESEKEVVTITVTDCETEPVSIDAVDAICFGQSVPELTATGDGTSEIRWYNAKGEKVGTGASYTPEITTAGSYKFYASQYSEANVCEGIQSDVALVVKATPAAPSLTANESCAGAALNNLTSSDNAFWYSSEDEASVLNETASMKYTPADLEETTTFYARTELNGCYSDFVSVVYTINETPAVPEITPTKACIGTTADYVVKAVAATGCTLQWYDESGNAKGTDASQVVSGITGADEYTYTVKQKSDKNCMSAAAEATLTVNALPTPIIELSQKEFCQSVADEITLTANNNGVTGTGVFKLNDNVATSFVPSDFAINDVLNIEYTLTDGETGCSGVAPAQQISIINCNDDPVASIMVTPDEVVLKSISATSKLTATLTYDGSEGKYNSAVAWTSDNETVATVDQNGVVTAMSVGTANITVKSTYTEGKSAVCKVEVVVPVTNVTFSESSITIGSGQSKDLSTIVSYEPEVAVVTYSWIASDGLTITEAGILTAEETLNDGTGTVKVTATTTDGTSKTATLNVSIVAKTVLVESIAIKEGTTMTLQEGATYTMKQPTVSQATDMSFTWSIDGEGATITSDGEITVTGKSGDSFKVVATANDGSEVKGECTVTISDQIIPATALAFDVEGTPEIFASETIDMAELLVITPDNATIQSIAWALGNSTYASISEAGVLSGVADEVNKAGISRQVSVTATVTSTDGSVLKKQQTVKINPDPIAVTSITIPESVSIEVGGTYKISKVDIQPLNADNKEYVWSIKTENAPATIDEEGTITVNADAPINSTFSVIATAQDFKGVVSNECVVTVLQQTVKITDIRVDVSELTLEAGGSSETFYVSLVPEETTQTNYEVTTSSDAIILTDNGDGSYTVRGIAGTAGSEIVIKSIDNSALSKTINVVVTELVKSIKVKGSQQMTVGMTTNLSVEVADATASDKTVTWSSSNEEIATVTQFGVVLAKAPGIVQITATANDGSGVSNFIDISIDKIPVETITSKDIALEFGQSTGIKATIAPSNATYKELTYTVADPSIISVDVDGIITTLAQGETMVTIQALADGVEAQIKVTVTAVRADKEALIQLIENEQWGAYSVYYKVDAGDIIIGWAKGQISPLIYNEFQNAWMDAQTVRYEEFATQQKVDAAALRLKKAIEAMGEDPDVEVYDAIEDVATINAKVYPTLVSEFVTVEADNLKSVKVVSLAGKVVYQEVANSNEVEINASNFAQGTYSVIIETEDGMVVKSFIKK